MPLYKEELKTLRPEFPEGIGALFTLREGGVSSGPYGTVSGIMGLNVGSHVNDNAACVRMNRQIVAGLCPSEPRWITQVHGTVTLNAAEVDSDEIECDATYTTQPGVVCAVQVADCLPVLVAARNGKGVAAIHAGWKGLASGVIESALEALRAAVNDPSVTYQAWLGPRIGKDDFEAGPEVREQFLAHFPEGAGCVREGEGDRCFIDMAGFARLALAKFGITDVQDCNLSTVTDADRFYSYRRDGVTGRHAALIWIEPGE